MGQVLSIYKNNGRIEFVHNDEENLFWYQLIISFDRMSFKFNKWHY